MIRWKYLLPRLIIFLLLSSIVWIAKDGVVRWSFIRGAQTLTGAKVEIGKLTSDLSDGKIHLVDVEFADPRDPMKNIFQADHAVLDLDTCSLLFKRFVIETGELKNLQFGTPRTESGQLNKLEDSAQGSIADWMPQSIKDRLKETGERFIDEIQIRAIDELNSQLATVRVANDLRNRWPEEFATQKDRAEKLKKQIRNIEREIKRPLDNPLRDFERIPAVIQRLQRLQNELQLGQSDLVRLRAQFQNDKRALLTAKKQDAQTIRNLKNVTKINGQSLSEILIGDYQTERIGEVVSWIQWFREAVPDPEKDFYPVRGRGVDVLFGNHHQPSLLVRQLHIDGEGTVGGEHFNFVGTAKNLTPQPKRHPESALFELRAQGERHVMITAEIDRRSDTKIDHLQILCPDIQMPGHRLGNDEVMLVNVSPGRMNAEISIRMEGDQLDGLLQFRQSGVSMNVNQLHAVVGGQQMADSLNFQLASVQEYTATVNLRGTLQDLEVEFDSDIGPKISNAMQLAVEAAFRQSVNTQLAKLDLLHQEQLSKLQGEFSGQFVEIRNLLKADSAVIANLQDLVPSLDRWSKIR